MLCLAHSCKIRRHPSPRTFQLAANFSRIKNCWLMLILASLCRNEDGNVMLLEIKCPSSRWKKPLTEKPLLAYLAECKQSKDIVLRKSHTYYTQIQICMYVLQLDECDLFLYCFVETKRRCTSSVMKNFSRTLYRSWDRFISHIIFKNLPHFRESEPVALRTSFEVLHVILCPSQMKIKASLLCLHKSCPGTAPDNLKKKTPEACSSGSGWCGCCACYGNFHIVPKKVGHGKCSQEMCTSLSAFSITTICDWPNHE